MKHQRSSSTPTWLLIGFAVIFLSPTGLVNGAPAKRESNDEDIDGDDNLNGELCYSLMDAENVTETVSFGGKTTAIFKIGPMDADERWEVDMILELKERFASRGYDRVTFILILPPADHKDISNFTSSPLFKNVTIIYDSEDLEHLPANSTTIVDSCGLVVYSIFSPWSSLQYPYVKAAILSAMFDQPCGTCGKESSMSQPSLDPQNRDVILSIDQPDKESRQVSFEDDPNMASLSTAASTTEPNASPDAGYLIPMRVIIPAEHVHRDSENPFGRFKKFQYYVLKSDDPEYHGHLENDQPDFVAVWRDLSAGLTSEEETTTQSVASTPETFTSPSSASTNSISEEEPVFGFPGSPKFTFGSSTSEFQPMTTTEEAVTEAASPLAAVPKAAANPLIYVDNNREKFKVRKKFRFGNAIAAYNPANFDEVELVRGEVRVFVQPLQEGDQKNVPRHVNDHYGNIIPWLEFVL